jgi:hypothetical protein
VGITRDYSNPRQAFGLYIGILLLLGLKLAVAG